MRWLGMLLACLSACSILYPAPTPIRATYYAKSPAAQEKTLLLLLPGRSDTAADFEKQGFIATARKSGAPIDLVAVDARVGYYIGKTLGKRVAEDVVVPARARGYRSLWLSGISMGGIGALIYAQQHPNEVDGVLAIAPFLGDEDVIKEIDQAGGLAKWKATGKAEPGDYQRELWRWLGHCLPQTPTRTQGCPRIFLGFGTSDRFVRAHRLLAAELPANQVLEVPGEHEWAPWLRVFALALPRMFRVD
jgi:pimeloyl-ACP methyl ester carboxylesterase